MPSFYQAFDGVAHGPITIASSLPGPSTKSNEQSSVYKMAPTPIEIPQNSRSVSNRSGHPSPYGGMTSNNLTRRQPGAQPTRAGQSASTSANANGPPHKKRKIGPQLQSAGAPPLEQIIKATGTRSASPQTIDVDVSEEEDPISQFPSNDARPLPHGYDAQINPRSKKKPFEELGVASTVGTSVSTVSGIDAVLRAVRSSPPAGGVRDKVQMFEGKASGGINADVSNQSVQSFAKFPRRDFSLSATKKTGMKKRIGDGGDRLMTAAGKRNASTSDSTQRLGTSASTNVVMSASPKPAVTSNLDQVTRRTSSAPSHHLGKAPAKPPEARGLPLKLWYCGGELRDEHGGSSLWVEQDRLVVKDAEQVIETIFYASVAHVETGEGNPLLILHLKPASKDAKRLESDFYMPSSQGPGGQINFDFIRDQHEGWSSSIFSNLIKCFKKRNITTTTISKANYTIRMLAAKHEAEAAAKGGSPDEYEGSGAVESNKLAVRTTAFYGETSTKTIKKPGSMRPIFNDEAKRPPAKRARSSSMSPPALLQAKVTRRSTRHSAPVPTSPSRPVINPDEIILVYPPSGTGALNITNGDLARLNPDEFLNDTLIEFALKLWLNTLREKNPTLAEQVHVFNSFFYKKLAVKSHADGYRSVKKWTSKFDLFDKKYIIVPINEHLHWYLAVIFNPSYVFYSPEARPPPQTRNTRRKSSSSETMSNPGSNDVSSLTRNDAEATQKPRVDLTETRTNSADIDEAESVIVEETPSLRNTHSTSVPDDSEMVPDSDDDDDRKEVEDNIRGLSLEEESGQSHNHEKTPDLTYPDSPMDLDDPAQTFKVKFVGASNGSDSPPNDPSVEPEGPEQSGIGISDQEMAELAVESTQTVSEESIRPKLEIFIFDSLGSKHPAAVGHLGKYLVSEAQDKKAAQLPLPDKVGRQVKAPRQPNHCDCGVYLLHFVETVMKDPETFLRLYGTKGFDGAHQFWDQPTLDSRRQNLQAKIVELSAEWKKAKGESIPPDKGARVDGGPQQADVEPSVSQGIEVLGNASNTRPDIDESDEPIITGETTGKKPIERIR